MVKNDMFFFYIVFVNIFVWGLMLFRYFMFFKWFVWFNCVVIKVIYFFLLFCIFFYEKYFFVLYIYEVIDFVDNFGCGCLYGFFLGDLFIRLVFFSFSV